jgi:steroid delta-isomerase-like uncharacterized protein
MSEHNRTLARRWFQEVWNDRREATIDELLHEDARGHMEGFETRGPADFKAVRAGLLDAFPDLHLDVEETVAEGETVVVRWRARGFHRGHGLGIAPSNQAAEFRGMTWMRFERGRLIEGWDAWNMGGLVARLSGNPASG